jgi:pimeloyl-ACP methyl ester carboxylesterase
MIDFDTTGDGQPLVLLAGQANSRHWWDPVRRDFARSHRTIAIDALGTGARHAYFEEFREEASPVVLDFLARYRLTGI